MYQEQLSQRVPGGGGLCFSLQYDESEPMPWSVQFGGGGHYFKTMPEAVQYIRSRKWITKAQVDSIIKALTSENNQ